MRNRDARSEARQIAADLIEQAITDGTLAQQVSQQYDIPDIGMIVKEVRAIVGKLRDQAQQAGEKL